MGMITKGETVRATATWKQAQFGAVMSGLLQCPTQLQRNTEKWRRLFPSESYDLAASRGFCLDDVWGPVHTTQKVTIHLFETVSIYGNTGLWGHCMWVHLLAEPV